MLFAIVARWSRGFSSSRARGTGTSRHDSLSVLDDLATLLASATLAALVSWAIDSLSWPGARLATPLLVAAALYLAIGMATGAALVPLWLCLRLLTPARTRWRSILAVCVAALVTGLAARQALGPLIAASSSARPVTTAAMACAGLVATSVVAWGLASSARPQVVHRIAPRRWPVVVALLVVSGVLLAMERTVLSPVYEKTYSFVEGLGHLALVLAIANVLSGRAGATWARTTVRVLAIAGVAWLVVFASSRPLRRAIERTLPAVWEEPVHAARWLRRVRRIEAPRDAPPELRRLAEKYHLAEDLSVEEQWLVRDGAAPPPAREPSPAAAPWNVVVFFVDTLRADVAHDPTTMPETVAWMRDNQWFSRAYSTGSSTLLMLAPLLGCRYDATPSDRPILLEAARASGMRTRMVIPKSASDYHRGHFPELRFPEEEIVPDGEGHAHVTTANEVVDRSLSWLRDERPDRFFLWLYQFDVHSSGDLDDRHVEEHAREGGFSKVEGLHWRYRAAARGIDQAFTRLRAGLEELALMDRTVVLFVSDHGESLGRQNFWGHTTYLWESLIRVPFALHVPGRQPRRSDTPVSTVDVGTTLERFIGPLGGRSCHGEDLLARRGDQPRRFPILFSAVVDGQLARIGMLARPERKLVVDLRSADARLLRISDGGSAEDDRSSAEADELTSGLDQLLRTPLYPRGP